MAEQASRGRIFPKGEFANNKGGKLSQFDYSQIRLFVVLSLNIMLRSHLDVSTHLSHSRGAVAATPV